MPLDKFFRVIYFSLYKEKFYLVDEWYIDNLYDKMKVSITVSSFHFCVTKKPYVSGRWVMGGRVRRN